LWYSVVCVIFVCSIAKRNSKVESRKHWWGMVLSGVWDMALFSLQNNLFPLPMLNYSSSTKSLPSVTTRRATIFGSTLLFLNLPNLNSTPLALPQLLLDDELQQQEDRVVQLFQVILTLLKYSCCICSV